MNPKNFRKLIESVNQVISLNEQGEGGNGGEEGGVVNPPPEQPPPPPIDPPDGEEGWTHPSGEPWGPDNGGQEYPPGSGNWYDPGWLEWWFGSKHQDNLRQQRALELEIRKKREEMDDPPTDGGSNDLSNPFHSLPKWLKDLWRQLKDVGPGGF